MANKILVEITHLLKEIKRIIDTLVKDRESAKRAKFQLEALKVRLEIQDKLTLPEQLAILADQTYEIIEGTGASKHKKLWAKCKLRLLLAIAERETTHSYVSGIGKWISGKNRLAKTVESIIISIILFRYWLPDFVAIVFSEHVLPKLGMRILRGALSAYLEFLRTRMKTPSPRATNFTPCFHLCLLTIIYHIILRKFLVQGIHSLAPDRAEKLSMLQLSLQEMLPLISIMICIAGWKLYSKHKGKLWKKFRRWLDKRKR